MNKEISFNQEEFENKVMDIIEQIVSIKPENTREDAIIISTKMLTKAKEKGNREIIAIYDRVLKEFSLASDEEYNSLKKQIFKT